MPHKYKRALAVAIIMLAMILVGCGPEGGRQRGAGFGTGADPGNHPATPEEMAPRSKVFPGESQP
jgi:hypothetical protein